MSKVRRAEPKSIDQLTREWDELAPERDRQLRAGIDLSFEHVLVPVTMRLLEGSDRSVLLDVGSGTGHFALIAADHAGSVLGIEPSGNAVSIARNVCAQRGNVHFVQSTVEEFAASSSGEVASAAVALMVMMAAPSIDRFARSVAQLLPRGAALVAVIPHPCFWPAYWGYAEAPWFDYSKELFIEAPFTISRSRTQVFTTHIHRPLSKYLSSLSEAGFRLDAFEEPMPSAEVESLYPAAWGFPRFAAARWIRI
jgi:SAM-dependent methyltransferase